MDGLFLKGSTLLSPTTPDAVKPDALSQQFSPDDQSDEPEPRSRVVISLTWEVENQVRRAQA